MSKLKAILVDDEEAARIALSKLLEWNAPEVEVLDTCEDVDLAVQSIKKYRPDIVFLDIEMPIKNGFDLLREIPKFDFEVVFVTAYDQFAVDAFKQHALAYLLKPVDEEDLKKVIERAKRQKFQSLNTESLSALFKTLQLNQPKFNKVAFPTMEGLELVSVDVITHCCSDGNYSRIFIKDQDQLMISKTLKQVEELLANYSQFVRVHHSHIINLYFVKRYNKGKGGNIELENGEIIPVSRSRKEELLELF